MNNLVKMTDAELRERLERVSEHVEWSYNDLLGELNRRAADRLARRIAVATYVASAAAVAAAVIAVVAVQKS